MIGLKLMKTVLLVEDYEDTRELMKFMLEALGHHVIEAVNGREAVILAQSNCLNLILMDIAMPVLDGIAATREIKQIDKLAAIPIIALTAHSEKYHLEALAAGVAEVIRKPIDFTDLEPILANYLKVKK